jgi:threonine dehydratase
VDAVVSAADLGRAREVVARHLAPTPLVRVEVPGFAAPTYLKLETVQPTGSFKVRGALASCSAYGDEGTPIVTASAGNHGLGVAYASRALGVAATIFVPTTASPAKLAGLQAGGADVRTVGDDFDQAERAALAYAAESGGRFVSAYADPQVIAGQSTVLAEVVEQLPGDLRVVVPVGGGGLCAGTAVAAGAASRDVAVHGVEATASMAVSAAMRAGRTVEVEVAPTLADGLAGNLEDGAGTPAILADHDVTMSAVSERQIRSGIRSLAFGYGVVAEGSAAVGLAAVQAGQVPADRPTVLFVTGRNIAGPTLCEILATSAT